MSKELPVPVMPESRLRMSPSLRRAVGGSALDAITLPSPDSRRLRGRLMEREEVASAIASLQRLDTLREGNSWRRLLSGDTHLSKGGVQLDPKHCIAAAGARNDTSVLSYGGAVAGPDYAALKREFPAARYKFYHSFQDAVRGNTYLTKLIEQASAQGLSMTMKTYDHAYDGVNVYTYHPRQMAALIATTYPAYTDAFLPAERFLQGQIRDVDPMHVGWVQEPGSPTDSHSARMGRLGMVLDNKGLNEGTYRLGCKEAGIRPDAPWLLNDDSLAAISAR